MADGFLHTGPTRSQLVAQLLAQGRREFPQQIQSVGEGFARTGSRLIDAFLQRRAIDEQLAQQEASQANFRAAFAPRDVEVGTLQAGLGQAPSLQGQVPGSEALLADALASARVPPVGQTGGGALLAALSQQQVAPAGDLGLTAGGAAPQLTVPDLRVGPTETISRQPTIQETGQQLLQDPATAEFGAQTLLAERARLQGLEESRLNRIRERGDFVFEAGVTAGFREPRAPNLIEVTRVDGGIELLNENNPAEARRAQELVSAGGRLTETRTATGRPGEFGGPSDPRSIVAANVNNANQLAFVNSQILDNLGPGAFTSAALGGGLQSLATGLVAELQAGASTLFGTPVDEIATQDDLIAGSLDTIEDIMGDVTDLQLGALSREQYRSAMNSLGYTIAFINNPDGRISEPDFQNALRQIGGNLSDPVVVRGVLESAYDRGINRIRGTIRTSASFLNAKQTNRDLTVDQHIEDLGLSFDQNPFETPTAQFEEGQTATNAQGQRIIFRNGQWVPVG